jgi:hypothetical protein
VADLEQWVNLTSDDKWIGEGLAERARMGTAVQVRFQFAQHERATVFITKRAFLLNAEYWERERRDTPGFRPNEFTRRRCRTDAEGVYILRTNVTLAGGDLFEFEGEDAAGNTVRADAIVTRRKLYYQVMGMAGVPLPGTANFEREYWNPGDNIYIKMVQYSPGRTIPARINVDHTVSADLNAVLTAARAQYDQSKAPFAMVVLAIRKNSLRGWETVTVPNVSFNGVYTLTSRRVLYDVADPAVDYYGYIRWRANTGGPLRTIAKTRLTRRGNFDIDIDTTGLPQNTAGRLSYRLRVIQFHGMGLSFNSKNLVMVATERFNGDAVTPEKLEYTITHEVGHKLGMVPGPQGTHTLDVQINTYYDGRGHRGGHCYHGTALVPTFIPPPGAPAVVPTPTPDCVMFGDIRNPTTRFCPDCRFSLRKLDLRASTNVGLRTRF